MIHNEHLDARGNCYIMDITVNGKRITIGSIYGPNQDDETFFTSIRTAIRSFGNEFVVIGGDWNTTTDILKMASVPSRRRSGWLSDMCNACNLTDPYHFFYPERR